MASEEPKLDVEQLLAGVDKTYSTKEAAEFLGRTDQWMYWALGQGTLVKEDGTPIKPLQAPSGKKMRFSLLTIKEIAACQYRRGNYTDSEIEAVLNRIVVTQQGGDWKQVEGQQKPEETEASDE